MEATMRLDALPREREAATTGRLARRLGETTLQRIEVLYGGLVAAAVAHDLGALRAIAARIAQEQPDAELSRCEARIAFPFVE